MKIREARDQKPVQKRLNYRGYIDSLCLGLWGRAADWTVDTSAPPLQAWVASSNWVVTCDTCREQVVIDIGEPYFCPNCLNAAYTGKARVVIFPNPQERRAIEILLVRRPNPNNRNWLPHESIDDLKMENEAHAISGALEQ